MLFFLGLMMGGTAGFLFATMAVAASRDASVREDLDFMQGLERAPLIPTDLDASPVNTGRYEIINEAVVSRSRTNLKTGTDE